MNDRKDERYSDDEAQRRFEAALRGARIAGHKSMDEIMKSGKSTGKAKRSPARKAGKRK